MADYSQGPIGGAPPPQPYIAPTSTPAGTSSANGFLSNEKPAYPPWLKFFPILILIFTLGVIAMIGYVVHTVNSGTESLGFNLFAGSWTLIVGTYLVLAFWFMPHIHYRWAIFILSALSCIWWLAAFAYLASNTRQLYEALDILKTYSSYPSGYGGYNFKRDLVAAASMTGAIIEKRQLSSTFSLSYYASVYGTLKTVAAVMAGASGIGAIVWLLFCAFTILYGLAMFRGGSSPAPTHEPKPEMYPEQSYGAAQPAYPPPVASDGFAPVKPDGVYDPRMQPGTEFMTPPPPPGTNQVGGMTYVNPQFGGPQQPGHLNAYEMGGAEPDRNYTVSPLSISEVQGSEPSNRVEMPAGGR